MRRIHGVVKHYAWGSPNELPEILGRPADGLPWAEYWLGTHHGGPARFEDGRHLHEETEQLPFLVKLLSAAEPLSLQTHPSDAQAAAGFAREEHAGIALTDPARVYRDMHAKPEVLIALTRFDALCGFRPVAATLQLLTDLGIHALAEALRSDGLQLTVGALYRGEIDTAAIEHACRAGRGQEAALVTELAGRYPGEPSAAVTLLLNRVTLHPGEAVYLTPGNLHAYLHGTAVEVMGPSDNVIRGGLTVKHVDVAALLDTLDFAPLADPVIRPHQANDGVWYYPTRRAPFVVHRLEIAADAEIYGEGLWLCTAGTHCGEGYVVLDGEHLRATAPATWFWISPSVPDPAT